MKVIYWISVGLVRAFCFIIRPESVVRDPSAQNKIDAITAKMAIYEFETCPYCLKVQRHLRRHSLSIEFRDIIKNATYASELIHHGGKRQVPCLRIENDEGQVHWLYESNDIIAYLNNTLNL
jgi:glutaredoxin